MKTNILFAILIFIMLGAVGYLIYSNNKLREELNEYRIQSTQIPPILPTIDSTVNVVSLKIDSLQKVNTDLNDKQLKYLRSLILRQKSVKKINTSTPQGIDSLVNSIKMLTE